MRIISPFHDYYDKAMAHGVDRGLVYLRRPQEIFAPSAKVEPPFKYLTAPRKFLQSTELVPLSVFFCGTVYRGIRVYLTAGEAKSLVAWCKSDVSAILGSFPEPRRSQLMERLEKPSLFTYDLAFGATGNTLMKWLTAGPALSGELSQKAVGLRAPILVWSPTEGVQANCQLALYQFYRAVDSYSAYQRLAQWVASNHTDPSMPPLAVSDQVRAQQHGFDKYSFRKPPTKKGGALATPSLSGCSRK